IIIYDIAAKLSASSSAANGSTSGLSSSSPQQSMASFSATFIPFATGHLISLADEWSSVNARLKQASQSSDEFSSSQKVLMDIS
ncbi:hypothetical protein ACSLPA_32740, partial [Escherichia coli]